MSFSERTKTIALAIVKIFETSKPFGDYSAVAVLNDGAGISYGTSQFTHKSGSLGAVLRRFALLGGKLPDAVEDHMASFTSKSNVMRVAGMKPVKDALKRLGSNPLMQRAQREIAFELYLKKALEACAGSGFVLPLSLAVIYDSINHGSYDKIRDRVKASDKDEKAWITEYVRKRDAWLESIPRLASTDYRTDFFLAQIARGNWNLDLPMTVHGFRLTEQVLFPKGVQEDGTAAASSPDELTQNVSDKGEQPTIGRQSSATQPPPAVVELPQVSAEKETEKEVSGIKASTAGAVTFITTTFGGLATFLAGFGWQIVVGVALFGGLFVAARFWYANREKQRAHEAQQERERRAHEIQMAMIRSAEDREKNTVVVVPQPMQNSEAAGEVSE